MPELPEVETMRSGLAPELEGRRIERVQLNRADLRFPFPESFAARLAGGRIGPLGRRAKYLLLPIEKPGRQETLVIHLGMSGRLVFEAGGTRLEPGEFYTDITRLAQHDHVIFTLNGGAKLTYNDVRRFGFMLLLGEADLAAHPAFAGMGPEPLGNAFNPAFLLERLAGKAAPIKAALLDQRIVAGLGNIYVCEALHRARLSPFRAAGSLTSAELGRLVPAIREVLLAAIQAGGSTLRDFRHQDGALGYFQHEFRVYDRQGAPCSHPGCAGAIERVVQAGRSSFFCAQCQA